METHRRKTLADFAALVVALAVCWMSERTNTPDLDTAAFVGRLGIGIVAGYLTHLWISTRDENHTT